LLAILLRELVALTKLKSKVKEKTCKQLKEIFLK